MDTDYLINRIRDEIHYTDAATDVAKTIIDVLVREGVDLRREPSLEDMKHILVAARRAADESQPVAC